MTHLLKAECAYIPNIHVVPYTFPLLNNVLNKRKLKCNLSAVMNMLLQFSSVLACVLLPFPLEQHRTAYESLSTLDMLTLSCS